MYNHHQKIMSYNVIKKNDIIFHPRPQCTEGEDMGHIDDAREEEEDKFWEWDLTRAPT